MISAKEDIVINGGGSYARFSAGTIELGTSGAFTAHASTHSFLGPKTASVNFAMSGASSVAEQTLRELHESNAWVEFKLVTPEGPIPGERYVLTDSNGSVHTGNVDDLGVARIEQIPAGRCKVEFPDLGYQVEADTI